MNAMKVAKGAAKTLPLSSTWDGEACLKFDGHEPLNKPHQSAGHFFSNGCCFDGQQDTREST